jgi:pyruvate kinase
MCFAQPHVVRLRSDGLTWRLEGCANARGCLLTRGLVPLLASPSPSGDAILQETVAIAVALNYVKAHDYIVCIQVRACAAAWRSCMAGRVI